MKAKVLIPFLMNGVKYKFSEVYDFSVEDFDYLKSINRIREFEEVEEKSVEDIKKEIINDGTLEKKKTRKKKEVSIETK